MSPTSLPRTMFVLSVLLNYLLFHPVEPVVESFCAGVPWDSYSKTKNLELHQGLLSIGGENIYITTSTTSESIVNHLWKANTAKSLTTDPKLDITIRGVEDSTHGQIVNGWLSISVRAEKRHAFMAMAVWALTEDGQNIGEFIHPSMADCSGISGGAKKSFAGRISYIPCSAVALNHPMTSNMFVYSERPSIMHAKQFNLLWQVSFTNCNYVKKFRFMFAASGGKWSKEKPMDDLFPWITQSNGFGLMYYGSEWIEPQFFGQAGPTPINGGKFDCMDANNIGKNSIPWIYPNFRGHGMIRKLEKFWLEPAWKGQLYDSAVNMKRTVCKAVQKSEASDKIPNFGGRCEQIVKLPNAQKEVSGNEAKTYQCPKDKLKPQEIGGKYEDYLVTLDKTLLNNCLCPSVPTKEDIERASRARRNQDDSIDRPENVYSEIALNCQSNASWIDPNEAGLCLDSAAGQVVYGVRQWHSVSMLFGVVVVNPAMTFMARYTKGHFTTHGPIHTHAIPLRSWHKYHVFLILPMFWMYATSMAAIGRQSSLFGYSVTPFGHFHRAGGYFLFGLALFQIVTGPLRPVNKPLRKLVIFLHWAGGWINHYLGLLLCIMTYRIPGSPTSFHSHVADRKKFMDIRSNVAPMILVVWAAIDIFLNMFLTFHVIAFDKRMKIERSHFPVIIPNLLNKTEVSLEVWDLHVAEEMYCKRVWGLYSILSGVTFISYCVSIYSFNNGVNQGFGRMYCTHDDNGVIGSPDRSAESSWYC